MGAYEIRGGNPLRGTVRIHGAKNSVLPILAATLVTGERCVLHNCPDISDVHNALEILRSLGCRTCFRNGTIEVDTYPANTCRISDELMGRMRGAILFLGALLTRFGEAELCQPGGCRLGDRPIDLHLKGLEHLGVSCRWEQERLHCRAEKPKGGCYAMTFPSVGATENLILAALGCHGETVLCNCAREPEIVDLIEFLRSCGADISGGGSSLLRIRERPLRGCTYPIMPDRIEAATYLSAAAATGGEIQLEGVCPAHLEAVLHVLERSGCEIVVQKDRICLRAKKLLAAGSVRTAPYDGFPTDAQAPLMAAMAVAKGITIFEETVFSDRFRHVPALQAMGADIRTTRHCAIVRGRSRLHGARAEATDLRGGAAMVIGALCAEGKSIITQTEHIERGYEAFVPTLRGCGADIKITEG